MPYPHSAQRCRSRLSEHPTAQQRRPQPLLPLAAVAIAAITHALAAPGATADVLTWDNLLGGDFDVAANWSPAAVPAPADTAVFGLGGAYAITFNGDIANDRLTLNQGDVTFDLSTHAYTLGASTSVVVGDVAGDNAVLRLNSGTLAALGSASIVGSAAGSSGAVIVSGPGATWANSGILGTGNSGNGTLLVESGAQVDNTDGYIGVANGSTGAVTVTGAGSAWTNSGSLFVGLLGGAEGTLTIADGGRLDVGGAGGTGTATIADSGDSLGAINIGAPQGHAPAPAGVLNAAAVFGGSDIGSSASLNFNHTNAGYAFENSSGAPIAINGGTSVNHLGTGETLLAGTHGYTGATVVRQGRLQVSGSITDTFSMTVGQTAGDDAELRITGGGEVSSGSADNPDRIGANAGSTGLVIVSGAGSAWNNVHSLWIGDGGQGTLRIEDGALVSSDFTSQFSVIGSTGHVTVTGAGSTWANNILGVFGGVLAVGPGGLVEVNSPVAFQMEGTLHLDLAGASGNGLIEVSDAEIDGALTVALINGFALGINQEFLFLDVADARTGTFNGLAEGGLVGSFNGVDLFITYAAGTGNDLALYTVPEPTSAAVLAVAGIALLSRRRR